MSDKPKYVIPSLGVTGKEIWEAWKALPNRPQEVIEATVAGMELITINAYGEPEIVRHDKGVDEQDNFTGYLSTVRELTVEEHDALYEAIARGWITIESRKRWGVLACMGYADAGQLVKVHHQATGRPLAEWLKSEEGQKWTVREARRDKELAERYASA